MSREIKFRAWDKEYGFMYQNAYPFEHLVYVEMHDDDETFAQYQHKMQVVNGKHFYWIIAKGMELMQFTEMQDSHGREIYDGDIVEIKQPYETIQAQVFWGEVTNSYQWMCGQTWLFRFTNGTQGPVLPYLRYGYELQIIGNIYENPDLVPV